VFPGWWRKYFIIGSNGGGSYFCLRIDGTPGVWFLWNDSGEVERSHPSLGDYLASRLEEYIGPTEPGAAEESPPGEIVPRFDGVYRSGKQGGYYYYLRFFDDGM
jgi:hypothetical protein